MSAYDAWKTEAPGDTAADHRFQDALERIEHEAVVAAAPLLAKLKLLSGDVWGALFAAGADATDMMGDDYGWLDNAIAALEDGVGNPNAVKAAREERGE